MKNKLWLLALIAVCGLTACSSDESSSEPDFEIIDLDGSNSGDSSGSGNKENTVQDGCNFTESDNVWKFTYSTWNIIDTYTWIDETTVEFTEYMNAYHMEDNDTTYTNVDRTQFFNQVMEDCLYYTSEENQ